MERCSCYWSAYLEQQDCVLAHDIVHRLQRILGDCGFSILGAMDYPLSIIPLSTLTCNVSTIVREEEFCLEKFVLESRLLSDSNIPLSSRSLRNERLSSLL